MLIFILIYYHLFFCFIFPSEIYFLVFSGVLCLVNFVFVTIFIQDVTEGIDLM